MGVNREKGSILIRGKGLGLAWQGGAWRGERGHGKDSLSEHERRELEIDFDIELDGYYALVPITKSEFEQIQNCGDIKNVAEVRACGSECKYCL